MDNSSSECRLAVRPPNEAEQRRKAVCLEQLAQDRQRLLMKWPFVGSIIMRMELVAVRDDRLMTAATDGDNIFVDINFYSKLTREERLFVLAHEVWHTAMLHFARRGNRDHRRFNIAADLEIHFMLQAEKMQEPYVLPHDPNWKDLSAEEIYERLPKNLEDMAKLPQKAKSSASLGDGDNSFDKHIYKDDNLPDTPPDAEHAEGKDRDNNDGQSDNNGDRQTDNNDGQTDKGDAGKPARECVIDADYTPAVTAETVERVRAKTVAAALQTERMQGKLPAGVKALLETLQTPSLPWQEMLKQFVTTCYGGKRRWLPPARRHVWQDLYLPSMRDERLKAVVALDTSGSTQGDLAVFFAELVSLMNSFGRYDLDVIQCDAKVQNVEHFSDANPPTPNKKWMAKGFGGTDFCPVFDYVHKTMREKPDLLLYFTDGCGTAPERQPAYPVMWVLTDNGTAPCHWGRVTHFKQTEERK